jgi:hypothetical protein
MEIGNRRSLPFSIWMEVMIESELKEWYYMLSWNTRLCKLMVAVRYKNISRFC